MTLLVISHTDHYEVNGTIVGWASTVQEINELAGVFTKIIHVGCLHKGIPAPLGLEQYTRGNIEFVPIPPAGGSGLKKLTHLTVLPVVVRTVFLQLKKASCFQFRAPTGMGLYLIPLLTLFTRKAGWFKYAGDWNSRNVPTSYTIQRFMLSRWQSRFVTINGSWSNQPRHCLSFENPCLTQSAIEFGRKVSGEKAYIPPYEIVFVGRLDHNKGIELLIRALASMSDRSVIGKIHLVGDGPERENLREIAQQTGLNVYFHGFLPRESVFEVLQKAHVLVLPSASEGFPKVLPEAWNFGCVPVVTRVSAIDQYLEHGVSGFLIEPGNRTIEGVRAMLTTVLHAKDLREIAARGRELVKRFSYDYYQSRIANEILIYD